MKPIELTADDLKQVGGGSKKGGKKKHGGKK